MRNLLAVFIPPEDSRHYHEFVVSLLDAFAPPTRFSSPNGHFLYISSFKEILKNMQYSIYRIYEKFSNLV